MSSGESGSQQLQLLFSKASIPARLRIILKEKINTDKNYRYTGVVEEISVALVQSLPACRRLLFPLLHAEKEIGDVWPQASPIRVNKRSFRFEFTANL